MLLSAYGAETVYYVSPAGDGTDGATWATAFTHPQDAVDAAAAAANPDGARVVIADATYKVRNASDAAVVKISAGSIALEPQNAGGHGVIIDGGTETTTGSGNVRRALTIDAGLSGVSVTGLVLTNGFMVYNKSLQASTLHARSGTISDCRIHGWSRRRCAFVYLAGDAVLSRCLVTRAAAADYSASMSSVDVGIYLAGNAQVLDSTIEDLDCYKGEGIFGAVNMTSSANVLKGCVIRGVHAGIPRDSGGAGFGKSSGAGVYATAGTIEDCVVTNNSVFGYGGGLYLNGSVTVRNCVVWDNDATAGGRDIFIAAGKNPSITGTASSDTPDDASGNTDLDPTAGFCAVGGATLGKAPFAASFRSADGDATALWNFGDGATAIGASPSHTYAAPGVYTVSRTAGGATETRPGYVVVSGERLYVSKTGSATAPYDTEAKAARHPQDAIDLATAGTEVVVGDGAYAARNAMDYSVLVFRRDGVALRSANGRGRVFIDGGTADPANGTVRRVLTIGAGLDGVALSGLVLSNGVMKYNTSVYPSSTMAYSGTIADTDIDVYCNRRCECVAFGGSLVYTNGHFTRRRVSTNACQTRDVAMKLFGSAQLVGIHVHDIANIGSASYSLPAVEMTSASALVRNCLFTGITTGGSSGTATKGAALYASAGTVENCTFVGNKAYGAGGGAYVEPAVVFRNNVAWGNTASTGNGNDVFCSSYANVSHSCASDLSAGVNGNVASAPVFADAANGDYSLSPDSPVGIDAGEDQPWMAGATDLAGNPRLHGDAVDMGAYECQTASDALVADFAVTSAHFGHAPLAATFAATVAGDSAGVTFAWDFGDGSSLPASAAHDAPGHTYSAVGAYNVTLTAAKEGVGDLVVCKTNCIVVVGDVCYAAPGSAGTPPYDTWAKATSNLQAAVALCPARVVATNGTYSLDYTLGDFGLNLQNPIEVVSVNGPDKTVIDSGIDTPPSDSSSVRRIVTLAHAGAVLDGFTLTRACPPAVYATAGALLNCVVTNSFRTYNEPLVRLSGTAAATNCVFDASGYTCMHVNAETTAVRIDGDASLSRSTVRNLSWTSNRANPDYARGGIIAIGAAAVRNVLVHDIRFDLNDAARAPAGIYASGDATVENCTVRDCWARYASCGGLGVYAAGVSVRNCVAYGNTAGAVGDETAIDALFPSTPAAFAHNLVGVAALPANAEACLVGENPLFAGASGFEISNGSPCRNRGVRLEWMDGATDIAGKKRCFGRPDIGCWEIPILDRSLISVR